MTANVAELLAVAGSDAPQGAGLVDIRSGRRWSWGEVDDAATRVANGLAELGLVAGNRVVLATRNRAELVMAYFAALRAHLVAVPVNPRAPGEELARVVADSGAKVAVCDDSTLDALRSTGVRLVAVGAEGRPGELPFDDLLRSSPADLPPARDPAALAVLLYTSGTSAQPRAAMLSHRALLANVEQVAAIEPPMMQATDVVYGVLPLFHVYGLNAVLGQVVRQRATLVLADGFDAEASLAQVEDHQVTVLPVAPAVLAHWSALTGSTDLRQRLAHVRLLLSGSAPLPADLQTRFTAATGLVVHQGYGLTEAAPVVTSTLCSNGTVTPGSVGAPLPGVQLRLVDEAGSATDPGDTGEIWVRGDNLFDGYWPDRAEAPVDSWLATGDVGYVDAAGDLFLVDRVKELIIVSGFNVYPTEVEDVLRSVDGVRDAAVVAEPGPAGAEVVVAFVTAEGSPEPDLAARCERVCAQRLAGYKRPSRIEVVAALPHTGTGTIARGRLRATLRREHGELLG